MGKFITLLVGLALLGQHAGAQQAVTTVEVFANSAMHVSPSTSEALPLPYQLNIYRVDGMQNLEAQINQVLPQDEEQAKAWVAANQAKLQKQLRPAAQNTAAGITLAMRYRLQRIPAIVINRQTVVYGITDVNEAIALAQAHQQAGGHTQ